ncbi:MAG: hypothetical protein Q9204_006519, partial [Flavoplaca sp. TL-2023a]
SSHVFIHQALKNGKELSQWYHEYALHAIDQYKQTQTDHLIDGTAAGDLTACLNELVLKLSSDQQREVRNQLDQHAAFLDGLAQQSKARMDGTIRASLTSDNSEYSDVEGSPGMFLLKWQHFIDQTPITPGPNNGPPRTGKSESVVDATAVDVDGEKPPVIYQESSKTDALSLEPPDVSAVVQLLVPVFKEKLQRIVASKERKGQSVLDSDAERLCCMLSWEHHRLLHFSDMATLDQILTSEPLQKEADWAAIRMTLSQLKDLLGDRSLLNQKYGFTYSESILQNDGTANKANEANEETPAHTYPGLSLLFRFESSANFSRLKCTVMEEAGIQRFLFDVSRSIGRLYSVFQNDINEQEALLRAQRRKLEEAMLLSVCTFDRVIIHQLAKRTFGSGVVKSKGWKSSMLEHELLEAIDAGALTAVMPLLDRGATASTMDILGYSP